MQVLKSELVLAVAAAGLSWSLIGLYTWAMRASQRLEVPNPRSMHKIPIPVGAGIAIVGTMLVLWPWWGDAPRGSTLVLLTGVAGLGMLSWIDDLRGLPAAVRLIAQAIAVGSCLACLLPEARLLPVVPVPFERLLLGIAWLWFVNLFNFMDGIDGLAGSEALAIALGYLIISAYAGLDGELWRLAIIIVASATAYLFWNWHPASVLMGDAGSVPLGFLLGWLMLDLALQGYWGAALILPLYFVADATLTLAARTLHGDKPWRAHRQHFYQRAVLGGATSPGVVWIVSAGNAALVVLALVSLVHPVLAATAALCVVAGLLARLSRLGRRRDSAKRRCGRRPAATAAEVD